ncbi:MAG: FmdB family zinc ribbon protein [Armatimonadota bacterium]
MPIFEYRCQNCGRKFSALVGVVADPGPLECPRCHGTELTKLISRVSRLRSEDEVLESLADPSSLGDLDENDPKSVARWMKKMSKEMGDEFGDDFEEALEEAEAEAEGEGGEEASESTSSDLE